MLRLVGVFYNVGILRGLIRVYGSDLRSFYRICFVWREEEKVLINFELK